MAAANSAANWMNRCRRLHVYYQDEGSRKLEAIAQWTPRLIYGIVAGHYRLSKSSGFTLGYFNQISNALTKGF